MAFYLLKAEDARLHVSQGNRKVGKGIWTFSTLPGNKDNLLFIKGKGLLTNIPGTCSHYCNDCFNGGCYAVRDAKLHNNACIPAWGENTLLLRENPKRLFSEIDLLITVKNAKFNQTKDEDQKRIKIWRWHVSGEIESLKQLHMMNEVALKHPEVNFGVYTKNFDVLKKYIKKYGVNSIAENFIINISEWHGVAKRFLDKYPGVFNVFEYDDSNLKNCTMSEAEKQRLAQTPHCPAVKPDGSHGLKPDGTPITCDGCTNCYRKTGARTAVYAH